MSPEIKSSALACRFFIPRTAFTGRFLREPLGQQRAAAVPVSSARLVRSVKCALRCGALQAGCTGVLTMANGAQRRTCSRCPLAHSPSHALRLLPGMGSFWRLSYATRCTTLWADAQANGRLTRLKANIAACLVCFTRRTRWCVGPSSTKTWTPKADRQTPAGEGSRGRPVAASVVGSACRIFRQANSIRRRRRRRL